MAAALQGAGADEALFLAERQSGEFDARGGSFGRIWLAALGVREFDSLPLAELQNAHAGVFKRNEGDEGELHELDQLMADRADIEWLAMVSAERLSSARLCRFLRNRCFDFSIPCRMPQSAS